MKRIIILSSILGALLILVFFTIESHQRADLEVSGFLKSFQEAEFIQMKNVSLKKQESGFVISSLQRPADTEMLQGFMQTIGYLETVRIFTQEEVMKAEVSSFFDPHPLFIEFLNHQDHKMRFELGDLQPFGENFYGRIHSLEEGKEKISYGIFQFALPGFFAEDSPEGQTAGPYQVLNRYLQFQDYDFLSRTVFPENFSLSPMKFHSGMNGVFYVNFKRQETTPEIYSSLSYRENFFQKYQDDILGIRAIRVYDKEENLLRKSLGEWEFVFGKNSLKIFQKYRGKEGYFLVPSWESYIYEVKTEDAVKFFVNVQDFWDKKVFPNAFFTSTDEVVFKFFSQNQWHEILLKEGKDFRVSSSSKQSVSEEKFRSLLSFFIDRQAQRVRIMDTSFRKRLTEDPSLKLIWEGLELNFFCMGHQVWIENKTNQLGFLYLRSDDKEFSCLADEYFLLEENEGE